MGIAAFWFLGAVVIGIVANGRGRSGFGYFVIGLLLTPILAAILVLGLPSLKLAAGVPTAPTPETHDRCEKCSEFILPQATVCRFCGAPHVPDRAYLERAVDARVAAVRQESINQLIGVGFIVALIVGAVLLAR
jgi:hypothetical protein